MLSAAMAGLVRYQILGLDGEVPPGLERYQGWLEVPGLVRYQGR